MSKNNPVYSNSEILIMLNVIEKEMLSVFPAFPNKKTLKEIEIFNCWLKLLRKKL